MDHAWCRDVPRDLAVRAAEDGRSGPLPTLVEAIDAVWLHAPKAAPAANEGGGSNHGLRTERVTLEVTHDLDAPLGRWLVGVIDESLGFDEYVRVVEEANG